MSDPYQCAYCTGGGLVGTDAHDDTCPWRHVKEEKPAPVWRFCVGFAVLATIVFGTLGMGWYFVFNDQLRAAAFCIVLVFVESWMLPKPLAWAITRGYKEQSL